MLKNMVASALFAGIAAGLIAAALQLIFVQPLLLEAELYEAGAIVHFDGAGHHDADDPTAGDGHAHGNEASGGTVSRSLWTVAFSALIYSAYGLLLVAAMELARRSGAVISIRAGLIWGAAGYAAVQLAPAFGMPPELPGSAAAEVQPRQIWWFLTAAATSVALWMVAFPRAQWVWIVAIAVALIPHLIGAPEPTEMFGTAPPELAAHFAARALGTGLAAWLALGAFAGYFYRPSA